MYIICFLFVMVYINFSRRFPPLRLLRLYQQRGDWYWRFDLPDSRVPWGKQNASRCSEYHHVPWWYPRETHVHLSKQIQCHRWWGRSEKQRVRHLWSGNVGYLNFELYTFDFLNVKANRYDYNLTYQNINAYLFKPS